MEKYAIGMDFGSDSVRALLVNTSTGEELATSVHNYARWKEGKYCDASKNKFRQHPLDYIEGVENTIKTVLTSVNEEVRNSIVGIGIDTTGSTPVAVDKTGTPLALLPGFEENPNAMFVLWKDHTGIKEADEINELCRKWEVDYSKYEGGIYSSEWFWSKILHISRADQQVLEAGYSWVEHCDWIPFLLTGGTNVAEMKRSRCAAGHKALWHESFGGLPPNEFFVALDPILDGLTSRLYTKTFTSNVSAGTLSQEWASRLGLSTSVQVAVGAFDCHMGAVGVNIEPYFLTKVMGTSTCDILITPKSDEEHLVKGICGQVDGSVVPNMLGLEAGQSAFGDIYAWYNRLLSWPVTELVGHSSLLDQQTAEQLINETIESLIPKLSEAAANEPIGASGELALDWMNGRRTPDANQNLKGVISGINLGSTSPKVFRALVEATCFGAKKIADRFISEGIPIKGVIAIGGIAQKSPFIMQMMSDVLDMPIKVVRSEQACALGAAIFGAVASNLYKDTLDAMKAMGSPFEKVYQPNLDNVKVYQKVYARYNSIGAVLEQHSMKRLKKDTYRALKQECYEANMELNALGLVIYTFGNVSAVDRENGVFAIKPSGVAYEVLKPEDMVIVDFDNNIVEGTMRPSSDTKTHAYLYKNWDDIGGIAHTHALFSVAWAQSQLDIPIFGTTHADHLTVDVPCAPPMNDELIQGNYEHNTGIQILNCFQDKNISHKEVEMILIGNHGPFTWGKDAAKAVYNSKVLETISQMAYTTLQINPSAPKLKDSLIKKHFDRKHGKDSYYGQD